MRLLLQVHKWLAVVTAVATMAWFISGMALVVPERYRTLSPGLGGDGSATARFEDVTVTVSAAVAAVRDRAGKPIRVVAVRLRSLPERLAFEVSTEADGSYLVDGQSGAVFTVDEQLACRMVARAIGANSTLGPMTLQKRPTADCFVQQPAYRVTVAGWKGTVFCISTATGNFQHSDRFSQALQAIIGWHDFRVLRPWLPQAAIRVVLLAFALLGTVMSGAGVLILWLQLQRWWGRARALATSRALTSENE